MKYLVSFRDPNNPRSVATIENNTKVVYFPMHFRTDLDKLTINAAGELKLTIGTWVRMNGKPISNATKKQFLVGFK
ncbi:MAG: hypothetical protein QG646_4144 [Euryarchaeota archaeon]|nr:hypothetical protein [Euryarchaeota archaeon]